MNTYGRNPMKPITLICGFLFLFAGPLKADIPDLEPGVKIKNGAIDLKVKYTSCPTVADWNNDGAKDLVVSQETNGNVYLFLNQGTDLNPVFNGGSTIKSAGAPITTTFT